MGIQALSSLRESLSLFVALILVVSSSASLVGCSKKSDEVFTVSSQEVDDEVDDEEDGASVSKLALTDEEKETLYTELKNDTYILATVAKPDSIDEVLNYFPFSRIVKAKVTTQSSGKVDIEFLDSSGAKVNTPKTFLAQSKGFVGDGILILNLITKVSRVYTTVFIDLNDGNKVSGLAGSGLVTLSVESIPKGIPILCKATNTEYKAVDCQIARESGRVVAREVK